LDSRRRTEIEVNRDDLSRLVDERLALNAVRSAYPHLQFLNDLLDAPHAGLAEHFPETSAGEVRPRSGESYYAADGVRYVGRDDGSMVPVRADQLEPMPENIWDADKFSALVEAAESGEDPAVDPGYADLWLEDGELRAQVRDGNHRTFAPVAAGGDFSWVMMSDRTKQELNERAAPEALYRAVRKAQKGAGAPLFKREQASRVRPGKRAELLEAERRYLDLEAQIDDLQRGLLQIYGPSTRSGGYSLEEQLRRPAVFWRQRLGELSAEQREAYHDSALGERLRVLYDERMDLGSRLYDLRKAAGLKHGERLDPVTGKVVQQ
jgi:hypothetical protein